MWHLSGEKLAKTVKRPQMQHTENTDKNNSKPAKTLTGGARRFCIAPMMDWSDRHCRMFWRQLSRQAVLYTEMVTTGAIIHAGPERFLRFHDDEHPIALQLGGSNPKDLAHCSKIAEDWGYDEVNLNCGCPSDRVQSGQAQRG